MLSGDSEELDAIAACRTKLSPEARRELEYLEATVHPATIALFRLAVKRRRCAVKSLGRMRGASSFLIPAPKWAPAEEEVWGALAASGKADGKGAGHKGGGRQRRAADARRPAWVQAHRLYHSPGRQRSTAPD